MRILVTGGLGYIGSHTIVALIRAGHQIVIFDNSSEPVPGPLKEVALFHGDICNLADIKAVFSKTKFDAVIHCAAKIEVRESQKDPALYYQVNVLGTLQLLEVMRANQVPIIIFSSTGSVYAQDQPVPFTETSQTNPLNVYAQTKLTVEKILASYATAYQMGAIVLRYFNAAGASLDSSLGENHQPESHLIPIAILSALKQNQMTINGKDLPTEDGTAIRDFVHVLDIAQAHVLAIEHAQFNKQFELFNIGSGTGYSVKQVVETVEKVSGLKVPVTYGPAKDGDPIKITASNQKIKEILGWSPKYSQLETILQTAYHWHKAQKL